MDLHLLHVFHITAAQGSISKAAQHLGYAQSNVTNKIKQLEADLNTQLFYRHNKGILLTPSGHTLLPFAEKILHLTDEAKQAITGTTSPQGPLHIGSLETTAAVRLPTLLTNYHKRYPNVDLSISTGTSDEGISSVLHYELDGAFVASPVEHPDLVQETFIEEELVLVTAVDHPVIRRISDLASRTILVFRNGCSYRSKLSSMLHDEGAAQVKIMEFGTLEGIIGCVAAGLGITLLPRSTVDMPQYRDQVRIHEIAEKYAKVSTVFVRRKDALVTPALQVFLSEMQDSNEQLEAL
ncbi:LysR family transcriptional regulator [Paenibacillus sp. R14(2021)]|uniref:LysR family transcriptional regulator n=1 Tax=Paenibacillus sp. R14(2021) TaxID=2859228 RepID=UPI001C615086|nr:LysR family transcriptional regulator [Paenibacillus sp. R14(2021)]